MVATGLLSLNVHEALNFDGTPICLHPDLFSNNNTSTDLQSYHTSTTNTVTGSMATTVVAGNHRFINKSSLHLNPTMSSDEGGTGTITTTNVKGSSGVPPSSSNLSTENKGVQVGDLIEIRVWDPLKTQQSQSNKSSTSNISSIMRQRGQSSLLGPTSLPIRNAGNHDVVPLSSQQSISITTDDNVTISSTGKESTDAVTLGVICDPINSMAPSPPISHPKSPIVPTNVSTSALLAKPPMQRRATTSLPLDAASKVSTIRSSNKQLPISRHVRDISDMTVDTICEGSTANDVTDAQSIKNTNHQSPMISSDQSASSEPLVPTSVVSNINDNNNKNDEAYDDDCMMWTMSQTHQLRLSFIMLVTEKSLTSLKGSARTQISILRPVADLYKLSSYDMVSVHVLNKDEDDELFSRRIGVDFLLVTIKDQFISRGDMHYFQDSLIGNWIYQGERLYEPTRGLQANAREIRNNAEHVLSGIVTPKTVITFRSRSSRIIWLIQISSEMWEYGPYDRNTDECVCETYFDKWITFVHKLFTKWKELEATHALTVVFFSRTYVSSNRNNIQLSQPQDVYGRFYEDHLRIVLENETCTDWHSLIVRIKEAFVRYPSEVNWTISNEEYTRKPSTASHGNVLEAINVTLNLLQFHYLDRDLQRTGNSIVVVTAGNGVFEVDRNLAGITYQRMMDNGIGSDMLSLGLPALHIAPFFLYSNPPSESLFDKTITQEQYYEVPHWMHLSFVSYESDDTVFVDHLFDLEDTKRNSDKVTAVQNGIEIGANGFVLQTSYNRSVDVNTSPVLQPASPIRKVPQGRSSGRQLIDGRDFRDILEACRPRNTVNIPTPLKALLKVYNEKDVSEKKDKESSQDDKGPEEWGAFHLEAQSELSSSNIERGPPASNSYDRVNSRQLSISPQRSIGMMLGSMPDRNVIGTSSSFESQVISTYRNFSSDHSTVQATRPIVQLQRTISLDLDIEDSNVMNSDTSNPPTSGVSSDEEEFDETEDSMKVANLMRTIMQNHDSKQLEPAISSPKLGPKVDQPSRVEIYTTATQPDNSQVSINNTSLQIGTGVNSRGVSTGGLGAALNKYKFSSARHQFPEADRGNTLLSRTTSLFGISGNIVQPPLRRIAGMESHGLSPLLLPPPVSSLSQQSSNNAAPEHIPLQNRFVTPKEYSTNNRTSQSIMDLSEGSKRKDLNGHDVAYSLSGSPPKMNAYGSPPKDKVIWLRSDTAVASSRARTWQRLSSPQTKPGVVSRRKKLFNPFRQEDEDEVLAMKSHNRRRWSHVFPLGEIEFKRHAGPNWKSLTAPAILPLRIDYFPLQEEIDHHFTTGFHNVTLSEFDHKNFSSNKDLLIEMVRQRLTQDFQVVPDDCIDVKKYRMEQLEGITSVNTTTVADRDSEDISRLFLSMGHILHTLTYYANKDIIEVRRYTAKETQKNYTVNYQYLSYCQETKGYNMCRQTFSKYTDQYNWNKVDNIICGDDDREMREGMRFKRIMFGIIPDKFGSDPTIEEAYVAKFRRFLEYLEKLRDKVESSTPLSIKFVTSAERQNQDESKLLDSLPGVERSSMVRFYVQLRKGKRDTLEWMEVAIDATFDTSWTYRIMFNWLVASSGKVDTQVQLLQRRCTQYGLRLIPFPQISVSRNVYLNPFKAPSILPVRKNKIDALWLDRTLVEMDFVYDGVFITEVGSILECLEDSQMFVFSRRRGSQQQLQRSTYINTTTLGKQFVHVSGTLFVRVIRDFNDMIIFLVLGNYRYMMAMNKDESLVQSYHSTYNALEKFISTL